MDSRIFLYSPHTCIPVTELVSLTFWNNFCLFNNYILYIYTTLYMHNIHVHIFYTNIQIYIKYTCMVNYVHINDLFTLPSWELQGWPWPSRESLEWQLQSVFHQCHWLLGQSFGQHCGKRERSRVRKVDNGHDIMKTRIFPNILKCRLIMVDVTGITVLLRVLYIYMYIPFNKVTETWGSIVSLEQQDKAWQRHQLLCNTGRGIMNSWTYWLVH